VGNTLEVEAPKATRIEFKVNRAELGLTEECRRFPHQIAFLCFAGDSVVVCVCLLAAFWLRFNTGLRQFGVEASGIMLGAYLSYIFFGSVSLLLVLAQRQMYESFWLSQRQFVFKKVAVACLIWGTGFLAFSLFFKFQPPLSRVYVASATLISMTGLYVWRRFLSCFLKRKTVANKLRQKILVVGWTEYVQKLKKIIEKNAAHPYELLCCVPVPGGRFQQQPPIEVQWITSHDEIRRLLQTLSIDIMLVADLNVPVKDLQALAALCEEELVQFKVVPSYFSILISGLYLETTSGIPILGISRLPLDRMFNRLIKRLLDIVGSVIGLLLSIPLILTFGLLVYIESPGPILYRQRRLGRNGKTFSIVKLRSMGLDAEQNGEIGWSTKDDPRRLRIGAFMRKWNIDEVPQFWNVLNGEMSLVGPRPERPELIVDFKHQIPHYNARHTVKPGITGWAQVNGLRGDTDLTERILHDLYYVEHWNLFFDLQTIFLTFFKHRNAY
jgi:exopolysaccharide biosynthesis polyprenyl glycosylphosphotransferase